MLNYIWLGLILFAVLIGGATGKMEAVTAGAFAMAKTAVDIALGFIGFFALWLGIMRLAERSGLIQVIAAGLRPLMRKLFPDVPPDHPAVGSMIMNMAANMLGLANAATPLGLRAMKHLDRLNPRPGVATNAMCTFLAINTSSIQLIPASAVAVLTAKGSLDPTAIIGTSIAATICAATAGIISVKLLEKLPSFRLPPLPAGVARDQSLEAAESEPAPEDAPVLLPLSGWRLAVLGLLVLFFAGVLASLAFPQLPAAFGLPANTTFAADSGVRRVIKAISLLAIPFLLCFFPVYAALRGLKVYEDFVEGAKEGFQTAVRIIPFLVTILVAIGMFRGAGGIEMITKAIGPALSMIGFPPDLLPMVLMRPLSGSGTMGLFVELVDRLGPDNIITRTAATIYGSTETTFYVIAVYFGSVGVRRTRHAVPAGLIADGTGVVAAIIICRFVFG